MIAFDVEIKRAIPTYGQDKVPGIEYCAGWKDFAGMGIACLCTIDVHTGEPRVYFEKDLPEAVEYLASEPILSFNGRRFDVPLINATGGVALPPLLSKHCDLLECVWIAKGLDPDHFGGAHRGWGLDTLCKATIHRGKIGNGADAAIWWQQNERARVINYCLDDCRLTVDLFRFATEHGYVQREVTRNPDSDVAFVGQHLRGI